MSKKIFYHKLVRDKVPQIIKAAGNKMKTRVLNKKEYEVELKKKLIEEVREFSEVPKEKILNELADVLELVKSIAAYYKISYKKLVNYQLKKGKERGGFLKRLFLVWSTKD